MIQVRYRQYSITGDGHKYFCVYVSPPQLECAHGVLWRVLEFLPRELYVACLSVWRNKLTALHWRYDRFKI